MKRHNFNWFTAQHLVLLRGESNLTSSSGGVVVGLHHEARGTLFDLQPIASTLRPRSRDLACLIAASLLVIVFTVYVYNQ